MARRDLSLVYVVRTGETNQTLRYSLRSVAACLPEARVVVVGHKPGWVQGVEHVHIHQHRNHRGNVPKLIRCLALSESLDDWVLMNDDFFALSEYPSVEPVHNGTMSELAARTGWMSGWYKKALNNTRKTLSEAGVQTPLAFDRVHRPMLFDNSKLTEVLESAESDVLIRSLYGNLVSGGEHACDAKTRGFTQRPPATGWVSVNRESWQGVTGRTIRTRFNEVCRYER